MKHLHVQLTRWVLEPDNPLTQGVEYFNYGVVERGGNGLFFWKKKGLFAPCVKHGQIDQFVMSCRVVGLDVEFAAVSGLVARMRATEDVPVMALSVVTDANQLSRSIWSNCGFLLAGDQYVLLSWVVGVPKPAHIKFAAV